MGRFQPLHKGHEAIIDEILAQGLKPLILLGGSGRFDDRHIYTDTERAIMLMKVYGSSLEIQPIKDQPDWDSWFDNIKKIVPSNSIIFINNKEQDRIDFTLYGKYYTDTFYNDIWQDQGYETHHVTFPAKLGVEHINATQVRENMYNNSWALSNKVYEYCKHLELTDV